ncbi:MarR family transcriptional regulator [Nocardioides sp. CER19]|uniref:MarR family winged helix-turn-helix transcriptional regulator n=1 Tax=Nocardioides sp. CER19 TaxID=3038538 RepID=UPI002447AA20|nr:MarR family transcriptional regulator [Nocardioides sp. CER19]MDH2413826.1 MarR family transcriptional regulator [Nocardioides sp. CER19]
MSDLETLAGELAMAVSLLRRRLQQHPLPGVPSIPEVSALVRLLRGGPATNSELARAEQISPQSMNATLASLEAKGLIERSADAADRRRVVLSLTQEGRDAVGHKRAVRARQIADALARLDADDVAALRAAAPVIDKLAREL